MKKFISLLLALVIALSLAALSPDFSSMEFVDSSKTGQDQYVGFDMTLAKYIAAARTEFAESTAAGYSCPIPAEAVSTIPE